MNIYIHTHVYMYIYTHISINSQVSSANVARGALEINK